MIHRTVHWRTARRILGVTAAVLVVAGTGIAAATDARADGYLSTAETTYVQANSNVVCLVIAEYPSTTGVMGVMQAVMEDGFAADDAVDIINASVQLSCDEYWPLLQRIGRQARAGSKGMAV